MSTTMNEADEWRPCHGCHQNFKECICQRRSAEVKMRTICPYCFSQMNLQPSTDDKQWIQRCGNCWRAFDAVRK